MTASAQPVVSFLVLTGDNPDHLGECIDSIRAQNFTDLEVLVLDTSTSLAATNLTQQYSRIDERVRHLILPMANRDLDSLNHGIQQARGDLIWLLSPANRLASAQCLKECVTQFILSPRLGLSFCRVQYMDEQSEPYERYSPPKKNSELPYHPTLYPGRMFFRQLLKGNFIPESAAIARKTCFLRAGGFQSELGVSSLWQSWLRFCLDWDVYFDPLPKVLSRRPRHAPEAHQGKSGAELKDDLRCYLALETYLKAHDYPAMFHHYAQFARLQFMRRKGFKMSIPERMIRFYRKLTDSALHLNPLKD
jgi:glycosyltransferase involved in cell wall biosynthesis